MSKIYQNDFAIYISHEKFVNSVYKSIEKCLNPNLFHIFNEYQSKKPAHSKSRNNVRKDTDKKCEKLKKEQEDVKIKFKQFMNVAPLERIFKSNLESTEQGGNKLALATAEAIYNESGREQIQNAFGSNPGPAMIKGINKCNYLFPENSTFFSKDVSEIGKHLEHQFFDLILLDPPWWNKYIRRKRKATSDGYDMMFNEDLKCLPVEKLLKKDGLVAIWCTNSEQNFDYLVTNILPKWNLDYLGKWYWLKVTTAGEPVCSFSEPPGKQPYEKIVFGCRKRDSPLPQDGQLVISIPSALHSHKPPLVELLKDFLPENPKCLEVFARYLLPDWTSYGNEVLRLQHESLYVPVELKPILDVETATKLDI